jgi:hypothetical protein
MRGRPYAQATGEILRVIGRAHVPSGLPESLHLMG